MQANNILTAIDKQGTGVKAGKNASSATPEVSFNQVLNKEISSTKKPEMDVTRPVNKTPTPAKNNNNVNNNNSNSNSANKMANNDNSAPATGKTEKTDSSTTDGTTVKDDELDTMKEDDLSAQILALVGNLATPPVVADVNKTNMSPGLDAVKAESLNSMSNTDVAAIAKLPGENPLATLTQAETNALIPVAPQASSQLTSITQQSQAEDASKSGVAAIAAQIMAVKIDDKSMGKLSENGLSTVASTIATENNGASNLTASPPTVLISVNQSLTKGATSTSAKTDQIDTAEEKLNAVKLNNLDVGKTVNDKSGDTRPQTLATDTPKAFTNDIALAKDVLAERMAEIKATPSGKDSQQVIAPPVVAANNVNSTQFNAAVIAAEQIAPRVGSNGWDKAVGQKVVWMVGSGLQSAELTLNPPDLGPLQVVLSVSNDQANASFSSAQPEVREALEAALPRLKQMLSDAGVQLTGFSVNSQAPGQGQNFTQQQARDMNPSRTTRGLTDNTISPAATNPVRIQSNNGLVDTFA
ncbi:flagellar hook-length control protein FliK [Undibacterium umbellatum]|uniref:Flagellar hook-length control protein FliK n=1 Tax=Undibacterium umbellatum TaxID=2762300 RepID=A0ABR6ZBL4_9BURK|nr:flagellar hook-length control protein FliK [Undibacterium umbellatum]MBC3909139.1 flagellar hook-length control protein FliK [Undibacterium umbellatum]